MPYLVLVSLVWAFSFGLIKGRLTGLEPAAVAAVRLGLPLVLFLPLLDLRGVGRRLGGALALVGAVQYGAMYVLYIHSFRTLQAHEVALFTVFTPLWVTALSDLARRRFTPRFWATSLLAVAGAGTVMWHGGARPGAWSGFALIQLSNAAFAWGQVRYKRLREAHPELRDRKVFGLLYLGGFVVAAAAAAFAWDGSLLSAGAGQWAALAYLGLVASGLGFFWWNVGATRVSPGTLAVMNDLKVPLAVAVSLVVFGETADPIRLAVGGGAIALALWLERRGPASATLATGT